MERPSLTKGNPSIIRQRGPTKDKFHGT